MAASDTGREWCERDVWGKCEECGRPATKYVLATDCERIARAAEGLEKALMEAKAALLSDVQQPTKSRSEQWFSNGVHTDTVYHLNGTICGHAAGLITAALFAFRAAKEGA